MDTKQKESNKKNVIVLTNTKIPLKNKFTLNELYKWNS